MELRQGRKGLDARYHYPGFVYWSIPSTILIILSLARCTKEMLLGMAPQSGSFFTPNTACPVECSFVRVWGYLEE